MPTCGIGITQWLAGWWIGHWGYPRRQSQQWEEGRERQTQRKTHREGNPGESHLHDIYWKSLKWAIEFLSFLIVSFNYFTIIILCHCMLFLFILIKKEGQKEERLEGKKERWDREWGRGERGDEGRRERKRVGSIKESQHSEMLKQNHLDWKGSPWAQVTSPLKWEW